MKAKATAALLARLPVAARAETDQAQAPRAETAQPWPMHGARDWWIPFQGLIWLLMVTALVMTASLVVIVLVLVRYLWRGAGHHGPGPGRSTALEHLDERYARGDIDRDEYFRRRRDIAGDCAGA